MKLTFSRSFVTNCDTVRATVYRGLQITQSSVNCSSDGVTIGNFTILKKWPNNKKIHFHATGKFNI